MNSKKEDKNTERVSEEPAAYGVHAQCEKKETVDLEDIQWMLHDSEGDIQALIRLSDFLHARGLRKQPSSVDSAIQVIDELLKEVGSLRVELAKRNSDV